MAGELDTLAVDPSMWRCGIGRALMSTALHSLMADGYREAVLWTLAGYERGKSFYASMDWHMDGGTRGGRFAIGVVCSQHADELVPRHGHNHPD